MDRVIDSGIAMLNAVGRMFCSHAWSVSLQVSVLIAVLLVVDLLLRRRVRAVVRYAMWMLVFVKLLLPPTLSLPTGIARDCQTGSHLAGLGLPRLARRCADSFDLSVAAGAVCQTVDSAQRAGIG